jgi:hypothetical protein
MKAKPSWDGVTKGFVGSLGTYRLCPNWLMNIPLALIDASKRFATRGSPRVVEKTTCVFLLVPLEFSGNGHAKKSELEQDLIDNGSRAGGAWTRALFSTLTALERAAAGAIPDEDLNSASELNYDLMWTWFLPNPLRPKQGSEEEMVLRLANR